MRLRGASMSGTARPHRSKSGVPRREAGHALWIFDFDNTLAPLEPAVDWAGSRRELQVWLAKQGVAETLFEEFPRGNLVLYEALRARFGAGDQATRAVLARDSGPPATAALGAILDGASAIIERHELAGVEAVAPAPGALEMLRALRVAGAKVAVVTSNSSRTVTAWLRAQKLLEVAGLVDVIVGRDSGLALKPSPAMVERALADCGVAPADAAFAGDSEADFHAARAAAVRFYGVNAQAEGRDRLSALGASPVFSSPSAMAVYFDLLGPLDAPIDQSRIG
jgi:phosphoglycolate phosphatase-like HAD superfamily hydrolase